ncbi:hypothetical protein PFISCL1PPCAC_20892, partial [Pristionchus fissidentatus]
DIHSTTVSQIPYLLVIFSSVRSQFSLPPPPPSPSTFSSDTTAERVIFTSDDDSLSSTVPRDVTLHLDAMIEDWETGFDRENSCLTDEVRKMMTSHQLGRHLSSSSHKSNSQQNHRDTTRRQRVETHAEFAFAGVVSLESFEDVDSDV